MMALEQFCGCFSILFFAATFFEKSGATSLKPEVATIIIGTIQFVGAYFSSAFIDRIGRKILLIATFSISFGMTLSGIATQMTVSGFDLTFIRIIPVFSVSLSVLFANIRLFTLTFVILTEISPSKVNLNSEFWIKLILRIFYFVSD